MGAAALVRELKENDSDFEWYPTTDEIIKIVNQDISTYFSLEIDNNFSVLDCGAGDGRVLEKLTGGKKFAIEKSKPLLAKLNKDIYVVGTDFFDQTLIDKPCDVLYINPPYLEYISWMIKAIEEANTKVIYFVVPERWKSVKEIANSLELRGAEHEVIGKFDFLGGDRKSRAKVDLIRINLSFKSNRLKSSRLIVDPFSAWFDKNFKRTDSDETPSDKCSSLETKIKNSLVQGNGIIKTLENLYQLDMKKLLDTYRFLCDLDPLILAEMNVDTDSLKESLKLRINGLKDLYWKKLFENLDKVTQRLTSYSRDRLHEKLTNNAHVDFTAANAYAIVIWVIKNANIYFEEQLVQTVERMTGQKNISLYKSNQRTFIDEDWRYGQKPKELDRYKLDYRVVLTHVGGLAGGWFTSGTNGLSNSAGRFFDDLCVLASNLGFATFETERYKSFQWESRLKNTFTYKDIATGKFEPLFEATAFMNGNVHVKFNKELICRLNVEFGRLKGWIRSPREAVYELGISQEEAEKGFKSAFSISNPDVLSLEAPQNI